ncbi:MAG: peptide chain release factor N(5)-glutamine methyltransferase [Syntrophales bacterium]|nr:peptide chain release factor N(5)-glutamine methyltransferase [Syntrophales bacterium]
MNILKILNQTTLNFQESGFSSSRLDAEVLLSTYLKTDRSGLYANFERLITDEDLIGFLSWVERRQKGEPIAYITGRKEFWSLTFEVNPEVLVPRPETELLVEEILKVCSEVKDRETAILEVGTGSGAISVAVASDFKKAHIVATDTSIEAIKVARKNAATNGVTERISFLHGNLLEPVSGNFDIIVSNPPYISEEEFEHLPVEVRIFEPKGALLAGPDGTEFHYDLIREGSHYLNFGGWLFMEIGAGQKGAVEDMLRKNKVYDSIGFRTDYGGIERVAMARRK